MISKLLLFSHDVSLEGRVSQMLAPFAWRCSRHDAPQPILDEAARIRPPAILVDGAALRAGEVVAAIRAQAPPLNGTPILALGLDHAGGAGGPLTLPLHEEAFLKLLREWAGPLESRALRRAPWKPRYRLIRLLGLEAADAMLLRLRDVLAEAIADHAAGRPLSAHRLAGVAGLCGFSELAGAWSRTDRGEDGSLPQAIAASRETIDEIELALR